jgi:hypothetical protein
MEYTWDIHGYTMDIQPSGYTLYIPRIPTKYIHKAQIHVFAKVEKFSARRGTISNARVLI